MAYTKRNKEKLRRYVGRIMRKIYVPLYSALYELSKEERIDEVQILFDSSSICQLIRSERL